MNRAASLLRKPAVLAVVLLLSGGGACLVMLPLFGVAGYELGEAMAAGVGLLGGVVGIAAAFQERRLIQGKGLRPSKVVRTDSALKSAGSAIAACALLNLAMLVPPFVAAVLFAVTSSRCSPLANVAFYPLLAIPSALAASAAGVLAGFASPHPFRAGALYLTAVLISAAATVWPLMLGPQVYALNHFLGYVPGPVYDEALSVPPGLLWFRLETVLLTGVIWGLAGLSLDMRSGGLRAPRLRPPALLLIAVLGVVIFAIERQAEPLGIRITDQFLESTLGGVRHTPHFRIIYPLGKPKEEIDRLARDVEFRYSQVREFLGSALGAPIQVYLYHSPEQKQALVGAAATQFAKPWRSEIHLNDAPFPHSGLKHELVHVMAAPFGTGPFHVTSRFGIWPQMGIIEALAVAGDNPTDELSLHEWAAAMRKKKLAPEVRSLFQTTTFYRSAAPRAYTMAGSFLRYLVETYGTEKLRALYAHGDFHRVYQRSLDSLVSQWETFLDSIPLNASAVSQAFARFRHGSIVSRPCAREVANLQAQAAGLLQSDPAQALLLYERCVYIQPDEPLFRLGKAKALERSGQKEEAALTLSRLAEQEEEEPALESEVLMAEADLAWKRGASDEAAKYLRRVLELSPSTSIDRAARIKLAALASAASSVIWSYLAEEHDELRLFRLSEALERNRNDLYINYLLGRRLTQLRSGTRAAHYLTMALSGELPESIRREALRLKVEAEYLAGDCVAVKNDIGLLADVGATYKSSLSEWLDRCDFEEREFNGPLVSDRPE